MTDRFVTAEERRPTPPVRHPAVAGMFYPEDPETLRAMVEDLLSQARVSDGTPKAIIAPHAGYIYSGAIAASAYARLRQARNAIRRVVLLGPAHRVGFYGLALSSAESFETPLGRIELDHETIERIAALPEVFVYDSAHEQEHSLEVHLPFLQLVLDDFRLIPIVVGSATDAEVARVIEFLWDDPETLVVVSSDLSHYLDYESARRIDGITSSAIENLDGSRIGHDSACGYIPVRGLLAAARRRGLKASVVDLRNSGDTAGPHEQVVGYGAYVIG